MVLPPWVLLLNEVGLTVVSVVSGFYFYLSHVELSRGSAVGPWVQPLPRSGGFPGSTPGCGFPVWSLHDLAMLAWATSPLFVSLLFVSMCPTISIKTLHC